MTVFVPENPGTIVRHPRANTFDRPPYGNRSARQLSAVACLLLIVWSQALAQQDEFGIFIDPPKLTRQEAKTRPDDVSSKTSSKPGDTPSHLKMAWRGGMYIGQYRYDESRADYIPHGHGELSGHRWDDGTVAYVGQWQNGQRHGKGRATLPSGTLWTGEWKDDRVSGTGDLLSPKEAVLAEDIPLVDALDWQPHTLSDALAVVRAGPSNPESERIVAAFESELLNRAVETGDCPLLATFLAQADQSGAIREREVLRRHLPQMLRILESRVRGLLMPPAPRLKPAQIIVRNLGTWGKPWLDFIAATEKQPRDPAIADLIPSGERPYANPRHEFNWGNYGEALQRLKKQLDHRTTVAISTPEASVEAFRGAWRGWLDTRARLTISDVWPAPGKPAAPSLCWEKKIQPGEAVFLNGQRIPPHKATIRAPGPWGETVRCSIRSSNGSQWTYDIPLIPPSVEPTAPAADWIGRLLGFQGASLETARARLEAWTRNNLLSIELRQAATKAIALPAQIRVVAAKGGGPSLPCLDMSCTGEATITVDNKKVKRRGTRVLYPLHKAWGHTATVVTQNRFGIQQRQVLTLAPDGPLGTRMIALMGLKGRTSSAALATVQQWAEVLSSDLLAEARAACVVQGRTVIAGEPKDGMSWPTVRLANADNSRLCWSNETGLASAPAGTSVQLDGHRWGETFEYTIQNAHGVTQPGKLHLMPAREAALYRVDDQHWPHIGQQIASAELHFDAPRRRRFLSAVSNRIVETLPQAIENDGHPLRRIEVSSRTAALRAAAVRNVIAAITSLRNLDIGIEKASERGRFVTDGQKVRSQTTAVSYRNMHKDVDALILQHARSAVRAARKIGKRTTNQITRMIAETVTSRARCIQDAMPEKPGLHTSFPMVQDFLSSVADMQEENLLSIPPDGDLPDLLKDIRGLDAE